MSAPFRSSRTYILCGIILLCFSLLVNRLYQFQISQKISFQQKIPNTYEITVQEPSKRGLILDRNGIILADNIPNYCLNLNINAFKQSLPQATNKDLVKQLNEKLSPLLNQLDLKLTVSNRHLIFHQKNYHDLIPFTLFDHLSQEQYLDLLELLDPYKEFLELTTKYQRHYPYQSLASHILGYTKPWDRGMELGSSQGQIYDIEQGNEFGVNGIEQTQNKILQGKYGKKVVVANDKKQILNLIDNRPSQPGKNITLTIDAPLQRAAQESLRKVGRGAIVIIEVKTGEIWAMASAPDYDPNDFIGGISTERYNYYSNNLAAPFTNRAISAFAPGSIFKLPTAICLANKGIADKEFTCKGQITYGNHPIGCWIYNLNGGSHGKLALDEALACSCNNYFNLASNLIGSKQLSESYTQLHMGKALGVEIPNEQAGLITGNAYWLRHYSHNAKLSPVHGAFLSIGQGDSLATPLQLCFLTATIANSGKGLVPHLIKKQQPKKTIIDLRKQGITDLGLATIQKGMWSAVNATIGTAKSAQQEGLEIAAKTGTAQTSHYNKPANNAWTVAYAPYQNPKFAIVVLVPSGTSGGKVAAPIAGELLLVAHKRSQGNNLPLTPILPYEGHINIVENIDEEFSTNN